MDYQKFEITGYVYKIKRSKFGMDLYLKTLEDESDEKYPQHILASVSNKNMDKVDPSVDEGYKLKLTLIPMLSEGVSEKTNRAYAINNLRVIDCDVLEVGKPKPEPEPDDEDVPF